MRAALVESAIMEVEATLQKVLSLGNLILNKPIITIPTSDAFARQTH